MTFEVPVADPIQGQSSTDYSARRSFLSRYRPRCLVFTQPCVLQEPGRSFDAVPPTAWCKQPAALLGADPASASCRLPASYRLPGVCRGCLLRWVKCTEIGTRGQYRNRYKSEVFCMHPLDRRKKATRGWLGGRRRALSARSLSASQSLLERWSEQRQQELTALAAL